MKYSLQLIASSMHNSFFLKILISILFVLLLGIGLWACLDMGIGTDEAREYETYLVNINAFKGLLSGNFSPYQKLLEYGDRYYGVGFHLASNALSYLVNGSYPKIYEIDILGNYLVLNHISVFLAYICSGLLVGAIIYSVTQDIRISSLSLFAYLLWPYLLGHGLMNIKDIPFLFAWLICTSLLIRFLSSVNFRTSNASENQQKQGLNLLLLGLATGWLISIRISGILVLIQYFIMGSTYYLIGQFRYCEKKKLIHKVRYLFYFGLSLLITIYCINPILWSNPFEIVNAYKYMSQHPWQGNTLTAGRWLEPGNLLYIYIPLWLSIKLPLIVICGLTLLPLVFIRNASAKKIISSASISLLVGLTLTVLTIISLLIIRKVNLYNELRQVLFLFPILFILAVLSLFYLNRLLAYSALIISIPLFIWDDIRLHPYQYTYINEITRQFDIGQKFETDYFQFSAGKTAQWVNQEKIINREACIYVSPLHLWEYRVDPSKIHCVSPYPGDLSLQPRPFLFYWPVRNGSLARPPAGCNLIHREERKLPYSSITLAMGELYFCP